MCFLIRCTKDAILLTHQPGGILAKSESNHVKCKTEVEGILQKTDLLFKPQGHER